MCALVSRWTLRFSPQYRIPQIPHISAGHLFAFGDAIRDDFEILPQVAQRIIHRQRFVIRAQNMHFLASPDYLAPEYRAGAGKKSFAGKFKICSVAHNDCPWRTSTIPAPVEEFSIAAPTARRPRPAHREYHPMLFFCRGVGIATHGFRCGLRLESG